MFSTESEREVWTRLVEQAEDDWTIVANLRLTDEKKDHEADLIVLMPDVGVLVVEVKGGSVSVGDDGRWWQQSGSSRPREIHPVDQSRDTKYAVRAYVERDPRWRNSSRTRVRHGHAVVVPYTDLHEDFATPDCPRWMIHGRGDQADLAGRLWDIAARQETGHRVPSAEDCDLIVEVLLGRNLPQRSVLAEADEREGRADRLTVEQASILGVTRLLPRLEIRGGAGSGKTVLATTQAKELTRGSGGRSSQRVALLCYSIGLASYFRRAMAGVDRRHRPAFCGTFEDLARYLGVEVFGGRDDPGFWEERLPALMVELATGLPDGKKFDAVVVDEAQDFADLWWTPIMRCLRDEEAGGLYVYSDENQRVFQRFGRPPVPLVPLVLDHNLRNTRQIVDAFAPLAPMRMRAKGGEGPEVTYIPSALEDALEAADDAVDALLDDWRPEDVALLTTGARHDEQSSRQEQLGQDGYWDTFWDADQVFYGHVLGFKGLERRVVVLCANETGVKDRSRERLYVGLSRATDKLVVVGPPELIREIGGPEVAKRLGICH
ncbi:nuclease-related domain-containing DEAD/DEAH box helicase [Phycicoccus duodecadis]|uniref:UvrD-like helicase family protein n=1 Tax=Phycicoccus duodecadis TaxID=173053 RepID=A0A2N3YFW4_9MICO|nr:NERD domain-containing protein [Phycicoccus duodecadis]PKW25719.1 UvrD-like helicase family protein [Phycicoccus duodecadis]